MVVVIAGSDDITSPFRLQVMDMGKSPLLTAQVSCANSPSFTISTPKEKGTIIGGSKKGNVLIK